MTKTIIDVDDALLEQAMRFTGATTKRLLSTKPSPRR